MGRQPAPLVSDANDPKLPSAGKPRLTGCKMSGMPLTDHRQFSPRMTNWVSGEPQ